MGRIAVPSALGRAGRGLALAAGWVREYLDVGHELAGLAGEDVHAEGMALAPDHQQHPPFATFVVGAEPGMGGRVDVVFIIGQPDRRWGDVTMAFKSTTRFEFASREARQSTFQEILAGYRKVWSLLQKKDLRGFLDACDERSREIDLAYYKTPGETRAGLKKNRESAMNDPEYELGSVEPQPGTTWKFSVGSTGKLIALTTGERGSSILRYGMKNGTPFSLVFPVVFRKEGDKYIVTR